MIVRQCEKLADSRHDHVYLPAVQSGEDFIVIVKFHSIRMFRKVSVKPYRMSRIFLYADSHVKNIVNLDIA
jgi:hypothetical protein